MALAKSQPKGDVVDGVFVPTARAAHAQRIDLTDQEWVLFVQLWCVDNPNP
jgi:hypothetical protein